MKHLRCDAETIELTEHGRRLIKHCMPLEPFPHHEILDLCMMTHDALTEEMGYEFEKLDSLREQSGDLEQALSSPELGRFETVPLAQMMHRLSKIALGSPIAETYFVDY